MSNPLWNPGPSTWLYAGLRLDPENGNAKQETKRSCLVDSRWLQVCTMSQDRNLQLHFWVTSHPWGPCPPPLPGPKRDVAIAFAQVRKEARFLLQPPWFNHPLACLGDVSQSTKIWCPRLWFPASNTHEPPMYRMAWSLFAATTVKNRMFLGGTSPFFPGILLSRKPPGTPGKWRSVFEKNDG